MKKILFIHYGIDSQDRWGRTYPLAKGAVNYGLDVYLLTSDSHKGIKWNKRQADGITIISCQDILPHKLIRKGFGLISLFLRVIFTLFHRFDYVYVDCGEGINAGWPAKIAQWKGAVLMSEWGDLLGKGGFYDSKPKWYKIIYGWYYLWAELYFRKSANYTVVLSSMMKKHALKRGIPEEKIIVVPGGAITDIIQYGYQEKKKLGLNNDIIILGYIGIDQRGEIDDLKPLISVLNKEPFKRKFKLMTFGEKLSNETINKYHLSDIIINYGWLNFYKDYSMAQCVDIYVLMKTTNAERSSMGWPNKLGDYMALGRPVLLNLYGDIEEFVNRNPEGFITIDQSENTIEKQLKKIADGIYPLQSMGETNRFIAEKAISWNARFAKLMNDIN